MHTLQAITLSIDSGLLVLIWIVQAVVYPGFRYVDKDQFAISHQTYTRRMGWIAGPLMIAQLAVSSANLWTEPESIATLRHFTLVLGSWIVTFAVSVPLHNKLQKRGRHLETIDTLVSTNWFRTAIWTATFVLSLYDSLSR